MTFFINRHPGGTPRLLMAAGQDLEPYWEVYRQHLRGHVTQWMDRGKQMDCKVLLVSFVTFHSYGPFRSPTLSQKYCIGNLSPEDAKKAADFPFGDMYETDPIRDPNNLGCTVKPWCGEPRIDLLTRDYITPNELFLVRNHLAVPDIEPEDYELVIKGKGIKKHKFTLEDLKTKFPEHEVVTTLQCVAKICTTMTIRFLLHPTGSSVQ